MTRTTRASILLAAFVMLSGVLPAAAQERRPLPIAVLEVRGVASSLPADDVTMTDLGLSGELPSRLFGGVAGLHFFPVRRPGLALGVGGEGLLARAAGDIVDAAGAPTNRRVVRDLQGLAGIVSLNFGHETGWSHVSGGLGRLKFTNTTAPGMVGPTIESPYAWTLNAGAGARWFLSRHAAFGFDIRFYFTRAAAQTPASAGRGAARLLLLSAGVTIK